MLKTLCKLPNAPAIGVFPFPFTINFLECFLHLLSLLSYLPITPHSTRIWLLCDQFYKSNLSENTVDLWVTLQALSWHLRNTDICWPIFFLTLYIIGMKITTYMCSFSYFFEFPSWFFTHLLHAISAQPFSSYITISLVFLLHYSQFLITIHILVTPNSISLTNSPYWAIEPYTQLPIQ